MKETNRNRANVAKRRARQRKLRNRRIALTVCLMLVVMVASIGGTVAWLTASTTPVVNTFTYGDINIELKETTGENYKIIPGVDISKDPKVTVKAGSEACWLFVEVKEENWPTFTEKDSNVRKVDYAIADGWTAGEGKDGIPTNVYYRQVSATGTTPETYQVLAGDTTYTNGVVTVSENLTKDDLKTITTADQPKLTFTAYAVQKDGIADAATAWAKIPTGSTTTP